MPTKEMIAEVSGMDTCEEIYWILPSKTNRLPEPLVVIGYALHFETTKKRSRVRRLVFRVHILLEDVVSKRNPLAAAMFV